MADDLEIDLRRTHAGGEHVAAVHFDRLDTSAANDYKRIIFLHRDPRDTAVSGYYQVDRRRGGYDGSLSEFIRDPHHGVEKIARYNALWLELAATRPKMLPVAYEDLHADAVGTLAKIADFVGRRIARSDLVAVVERHTFEQMQQREKTGDFAAVYKGRLGATDANDPDSYKVRRGKIGGYRDELSREDIAFCDAVVDELELRRPGVNPAWFSSAQS